MQDTFTDSSHDGDDDDDDEHAVGIANEMDVDEAVEGVPDKHAAAAEEPWLDGPYWRVNDGEKRRSRPTTFVSGSWAHCSV